MYKIYSCPVATDPIETSVKIVEKNIGERKEISPSCLNRTIEKKIQYKINKTKVSRQIPQKKGFLLICPFG